MSFSRRTRSRLGCRADVLAALLVAPACTAGCGLQELLQHRGDPVVYAGALACGTDGYGNGTGWFLGVGVAEDPASPQWDVALQYNAVDVRAEKLSRVVLANNVFWHGGGRALGPMVHGGLGLTWTSWGDWGVGPLCGFGVAARAGRFQLQAYAGLSFWLGEVDDGFGVSSDADAYLSVSYCF